MMMLLVLWSSHHLRDLQLSQTVSLSLAASSVCEGNWSSPLFLWISLDVCDTYMLGEEESNRQQRETKSTWAHRSAGALLAVRWQGCVGVVGSKQWQNGEHSAVKRNCLAVGHLFRVSPRLHLRDFSSYIHTTASSLLQSHVSRDCSVSVTLAGKPLTETILSSLRLICVCWTSLRSEKRLCCTGME